MMFYLCGEWVCRNQQKRTLRILAGCSLLIIAFQCILHSSSIIDLAKDGLDQRPPSEADEEDGSSPKEGIDEVSRIRQQMIDNRLTDKSYQLDKPEKEDFSEHGQSRKIMEIFKWQKNGTYFEAGAYDGEFFSNSLLLERNHGWTGILVESSEMFFQRMLAKNRRAVLINTCVSPYPWYTTMNLTEIVTASNYQQESMSFLQGYLDPHASAQQRVRLVECYPLYSIPAAVDMTTLDVLMLDMQGPEVQILKTLPWSLANIKMIMMEISTIGSQGPGDMARREQEARGVLTKAGYKQVAVLERDFFFMRDD